MEQNTNIGYAFPLEKLGSDIARNEFNYQSILSGLIDWDKTTDETVTIRVAKDSDPWFEDFVIPSKKTVFDLNTVESSIAGVVEFGKFAMDSVLDLTLYGGKHNFPQGTFDANVDVLTATDELIVLDESNDSLFASGDTVIFESDGAVTWPMAFPQDLNATDKFTIESIDGMKVQLYADNFVHMNLQSVGSGNIKMRNLNPIPSIDSSEPGDISIFRVTVKDAGTADWGLYYYHLITSWQSGDEYRHGNIVFYNGVLYKVLIDFTNSTTNPFADTAHFEKLIKEWEVGGTYLTGDLVSYLGNLYRMLYADIDSTLNPENSLSFNEGESPYQLYAGKWVSGSFYGAGSYVFHNGNPFVNENEIGHSTGNPTISTSEWEMALILPVPVMGAFSSSAVIRWQIEFDVAKFVLKNISNLGEPSDANTDISINASVKTKEPASIYQRSVDIFPTSNYAFWPYDKTRIWNFFDVIKATDNIRPIDQRQDYSGVMTFQHVNPDTAKTVNFINYDGPDLDQGLCIYLTTECIVSGVGQRACIAAPEDGYTYEFYFRIWPNANYTDDVTRDHIINKSQIYVYSAPTLDNVKDNTCGNPIAKFSMARSTNFYTFGENIAIPDKPVCYRATFIFSAIENRWITLDYYQLPDHIFVGPVGFIDPQNPANMELNNDAIGNINPSATNIGYETAGFPLYQDPFSNPDLSPFRFSSLDDLENFKNRLI